MGKKCLTLGIWLIAGLFLSGFQNCAGSFRLFNFGASDDTNPPAQVLASTSNTNFTEEVYAGYQGWFTTGSDGIVNEWFHWAGNKNGQQVPTFDLLPDVSIYPQSALFEAPHLNGYKLFSSKDEIVVDTHVRLLSKTSIDGFAVQRFVGELDKDEETSTILKHQNTVLRNVRKCMEKYGKKFYVMYDISGGGDNWVAKIKRDFTETISGNLNLLGSPQYAKQDGRVVVTLWGLGFTDRPGTAQESLELVRWLQQDQHAFVVGGVPTHWRTLNDDSKPDFMDVYKACDSLQPWLVGRFKNDSSANKVYQSIVSADITEVKKWGKNYQTVIWPGFSWINLMKFYNQSSPLNEIPRMGGRFMWNQAKLSAQRGVSSYIAMFDEYDEGTAIAPAVTDRSQIPTGFTFLTLDADGIQMSSDFYIRLSSEIADMLKSKTPKDNFSTPYKASPLITVEEPVNTPLFQTLQAFHSGLCLDVAGYSTENGAMIQQWSCHGGDNQLWTISVDESTNEARIISKISGKCLDVVDGSSANGARIQQWDCNPDTPQQLWKVEIQDQGFRIVSVSSGKCLDVTDISADSGASIQQWDCTGGANQTWVLK